ncbi:MAG: AAA family ATPase [Planctomycetota bacterium]|jgi:pilus assembly protein CpaE
MSKPLRICLYNTVAEMTLTRPFETAKNVLNAGQASSWSELKDIIQHDNIDLVAVNLDSKDSLETIERIILTAPGCAVIGISSKTDPITIIKANRAGCSQFVPWPVDEQDLQEAIERIRTARSATTIHSKVICLIGSSGGAGTTTVACNLALEIGLLVDQQCALVDMNLELGDVGCFFDVQTKFSVADICQEGTEADSMMLAKAFHELPFKVSFLARPENLHDVEKVTPEGLTNMLAVAKQVYPYTVIDLPRNFNYLNDEILHRADKVLIITQLGVPFIRNATRILDYLTQIGIPHNNVEIVLNRYEADFANIAPGDVKEHFGKPIFGMIPNDYKRMKASLDHGHPIVADDSSNPARLAIQKIAKQITGEQTQNKDVPAVEQGFFSRLWKKNPQDNKAPADNNPNNQ